MTTTEFLQTLKAAQTHQTRLAGEVLDIWALILVRVWFRTAEGTNNNYQLPAPIPADTVVLCVRIGKKHEVIVKLDMPVPKADLGPGLIARIGNIVAAVDAIEDKAYASLPYQDLDLGGH